MLLYLFPALRVRGVEIVGISEGYCRAAATETQQFAFAAFLKALMLTIGIHLVTVIDIVHVFGDSADITLKTSASHEAPVGRDGEMAVAAVATVIDGIGV